MPVPFVFFVPKNFLIIYDLLSSKLSKVKNLICLHLATELPAPNLCCIFNIFFSLMQFSHLGKTTIKSVFFS